MKVFVNTLKGTHFEIEVTPQDTISDVKKNIETVQGVDVYPVAQQMLIHQGKVLKDGTTLEENKVAENSFIVIMISKKDCNRRTSCDSATIISDPEILQSSSSVSFQMDADNDFTFCQVSTSADETNELVSEIDDPSVKEESSIASSSKNNNGGFLWKDGLPNDSSSSKKEGTVGSLSFSVISTSTGSTQSNAKNLHQKLPEQKSSVKKQTVRAKVPFEKGYSQMDWLKLTRTHPDLAGLKGQSNRRLISMDEVRKHKLEGDMWTVLKGRVYNVSPYMKFHPGGVDMLMKTVGKDCTSLFNKYHAWVNAEFLLEKCLVGTLDESH